jgi:hypothetical protein
MPGEPDRLYIEARRALLDALEALKPHLDSLIVVGAQAIYLHAGEAEVAVAPYTKDGDVAIDPRKLGGDPALDEAMLDAGFTPGDQPGIWNRAGTLAQVDLLVPDSLGGPGRHRGARLTGHGRRAVRRVAGMEAALVDNAVTSIGALEPSDRRRVEVRVAGPGALLVTKLHKLGDRLAQPSRLNDKDAHDVYRLLVAAPTADLAARLNVLAADPVSSAATAAGIERLRSMFASPDAVGSQMAARTVGVLADPDTIAAATAALAEDVLRAMRS